MGSGEWEANNRMEVEQILIDLPSCNPRKERDVLACGDLLTALPWRTVYLVLSATTKEIEMQQTLAALGTFDLTGLIITKLDECETIGNVINAAWRSRLPLAYFTFGPRLVEDLQPAHISNLTEILFER